MTASRLQALRNKHAILSSRLDEAQRSLASSDYYLTLLKKRKLMLKDEIEGVRRTG